MSEGHTISKLFSNSPHAGYRLLAALLLSLALLLIDQRTSYLDPLRLALSYITGPIHQVAHAPTEATDWLAEQFQSHSTLITQNRNLRHNNLVLRQKAQQLAVLRAENARLRELLNSSRRVAKSVSIAEIIGISPDPDRQELVINRGKSDGVFQGQVVLDAHGVIGQVVAVGSMTSHVLLITDASFALSVRDNRNGLRSILSGSGQSNEMHLRYVPSSSDVKKGDLLVSTGLEGRFPSGYPVARVTQVTRSKGSPFLTITAQPEAHINRASHVLLVKQGKADD